MTHHFELHTAVTTACLCCRAPRVFRFSSPSDQVVCATCVHHLGSAKSERRDAEHVLMWEALYSDEVGAHEADVAASATAAIADAAIIATLTEQVASLTAVAAGDFASPTAGGVRELIENDVVRRAERNTTLANRRTDRVMTVLSALEKLHRDGPAGRCSCGKPITACAEYRAIEPERQAVVDWERRTRRA